MKQLIPSERIESKILLLRGKKVMLDRDLAALYGVPTKRLNEQVKRNRKRFPEDFMFQLTGKEKSEVVAICDHLKSLKYSPTLPYAFTEQGVAMLSSVLNSDRAIQVNIQIMRTFTKLREMLLTHADLKRKIETMERKYDQRFRIVFKVLRSLLEPPTRKMKEIGFKPQDD